MTIKKRIAINQPEVGKLIRELRLLTGLTQEQFAAVVGVTYPTVNQWENERSTPSPMAMRRIEEMVQEVGDQGQNLLVKYMPNSSVKK